MIIKNIILKEQIYHQLNKKQEELTKLDFKNIKKININSVNYHNKPILYDWNEIEQFENLENLTLNGFTIDDDIIGLINKYKFLQSLTLNHCNFATQKPLDSNIKCLIMTYSDLQNYYNCFNTLKQLKKLIIVESKSVDIAELCKLDKLITINIYNSNIKNSLLLNSFKSLKEFSYDGSVIDNLQIIENLRKDISVHYSEKYIFLN